MKMGFSLAILGLITTVVAHGTVSGIVADGVYYVGYNPADQYESVQPVLVAWYTPADLANGFIAPDAFATGDVICHLSATNGKVEAPVKAGGKVEFQWTPWPVSHKGPMIDYIANCNGPCETVDKTTLQFYKIDAVGLIDQSMTNGYWGSDVMIANNNSWTVTIPSTLATGNYVIRHETIALHAAQSADGAQDYPFCFNLAVTGTGSDTLSTGGTLGEALYKETDPGFIYDIYNVPLPPYTIPGPAMYSGAVSLVQSMPAAPTAFSNGVSTVGGAVPPPSTTPVAPGGTLTTSTKASTSTTAIPTSTTQIAPPPPASTSTAPVGGSVPKYGQCGGIGWTGATSCAAGSTCIVSNAYYSQCL